MYRIDGNALETLNIFLSHYHETYKLSVSKTTDTYVIGRKRGMVGEYLVKNGSLEKNGGEEIIVEPNVESITAAIQSQIKSVEPNLFEFERNDNPESILFSNLKKSKSRSSSGGRRRKTRRR